MKHLMIDFANTVLRFALVIAAVYVFAYDVGGLRTAITQPFVNAVVHVGDAAPTDR